MAKTILPVFEVPFQDKILIESGELNSAWQKFFRVIQENLNPLGREQYFDLLNNQAVAANIEGLSFNKARTGYALVEYLVQRVTTGGGATELIEAGSLRCVYKPTSNAWVLTEMPSPGPDNAGIVFSITAEGQVQYTTSNITGTASISKLIYRSRVLAAKNAQYSSQGVSR